MSIVTDLSVDTGGSARVDAAVAAAEAAATASGVTVRQLDGMDELRRVCALYDRIWGFGAKGAPVTSELLRAMSKAGSYVAGAFDGDDMVGACVGFFAPPTEEAMHSHIAGVSSRTRGRSVGFALKVHQRAWAMMRQVSEISWTFDPLVGRNAYFNLVKLGARPVEYLANFYGPMHDGINGNDDTDRLLVSWELDDPRVVAACSGAHAVVDLATERASGAVSALEVSETGEPVVYATEPGRTALVAVPPDIEGLRANDSACAARWRTAVRDVLGGLLADGACIRAFDRSDFYLVDPGDLT
ncbi:GNAT family N-acetyltransferase [Solicola gregarius]|uniref:GNAT family N-acetyltransferase n=1 Tax=Solicola gregarius TaxID=2908642 RepID=A0AA46TKA5_9ACTN|nr:GNAT family N-acetyltransferase [Solicola gregarius]UYM06894.1 GNAT family N-acetyltransferase [Solicola gregarius]